MSKLDIWMRESPWDKMENRWSEFFFQDQWCKDLRRKFLNRIAVLLGWFWLRYPYATAQYYNNILSDENVWCSIEVTAAQSAAACRSRDAPPSWQRHFTHPCFKKLCLSSLPIRYSIHGKTIVWHLTLMYCTHPPHPIYLQLLSLTYKDLPYRSRAVNLFRDDQSCKCNGLFIYLIIYYFDDNGFDNYTPTIKWLLNAGKLYLRCKRYKHFLLKIS